MQKLLRRESQLLNSGQVKKIISEIQLEGFQEMINKRRNCVDVDIAQIKCFSKPLGHGYLEIRLFSADDDESSIFLKKQAYENSQNLDIFSFFELEANYKAIKNFGIELLVSTFTNKHHGLILTSYHAKINPDEKMVNILSYAQNLDIAVQLISQDEYIKKAEDANEIIKRLDKAVEEVSLSNIFFFDFHNGIEKSLIPFYDIIQRAKLKLREDISVILAIEGICDKKDVISEKVPIYFNPK